MGRGGLRGRGFCHSRSAGMVPQERGGNAYEDGRRSLRRRRRGGWYGPRSSCADRAGGRQRSGCEPGLRMTDPPNHGAELRRGLGPSVFDQSGAPAMVHRTLGDWRDAGLPTIRDPAAWCRSRSMARRRALDRTGSCVRSHPEVAAMVSRSVRDRGSCAGVRREDRFPTPRARGPHRTGNGRGGRDPLVLRKSAEASRAAAPATPSVVPPGSPPRRVRIRDVGRSRKGSAGGGASPPVSHDRLRFGDSSTGDGPTTDDIMSVRMGIVGDCVGSRWSRRRWMAHLSGGEAPRHRVRGRSAATAIHDQRHDRRSKSEIEIGVRSHHATRRAIRRATRRGD